jgi:hypothetical protein
VGFRRLVMPPMVQSYCCYPVRAWRL